MSLMTGLLPSRHGLDRAFGSSGALGPGIPTLAEALARRGYLTHAVASDHSLDPRVGFDRGFRVFLDNQVRTADTLLPQVQQFLAGARSTRFVLFFHSYDPHGPLRDAATGAEISYATLMGPDRLSPATRQRVQRLYAEQVRRYDERFGDLVRILREAGVYEDTVFVFLADHGEELLERSTYLHGHSLFQELLRVPLYVRLPGGARGGSVVPGLVDLTDVAPTLLDLVGAPPLPGVDGRSFRAALEGRGRLERPLVVAEALAWGPERKAVADGRFKLLATLPPDHPAQRGARATAYDHVFDTAPGELLFDLREDPGETRNLVREAPAEATRLRRALEAHMARAAAAGGGKARVEVDEERLEALRALGYVQE